MDECSVSNFQIPIHQLLNQHLEILTPSSNKKRPRLQHQIPYKYDCQLGVKRKNKANLGVLL